MPTYQYACKECDHQFEAVQSFADASLTDCPQCTGPLRKLFGSVGVIFKGSGFYRTDSRSGKTQPSTTGTPSSDGSTTTSSEKKSETSTASTGSSASSTSKPGSAPASPAKV